MYVDLLWSCQTATEGGKLDSGISCRYTVKIVLLVLSYTVLKIRHTLTLCTLCINPSALLMQGAEGLMHVCLSIMHIGKAK